MPSKSVLIAQAFSKTGVLSTVVDSAPSVNTGQVDVATAAELPNTGNTEGDFAFVQATNRLYIWSGSGWYNIALINATPTWDSNGQPASSYELDADSPQTATTITLAASDPEGIPIQYSYVTGGSMDSIATVSQDSSVFTITPKNETQAPDGGTGSITFRATDGVNILPQVSSFTLNFISIIENSRYTTLLVTATDTSDNNNITDSSSNNHSITVTGYTHAGTFSPYRSGGYSTYFDGTGDYIEHQGTFTLPAGTNANWTIECWVNLDQVNLNQGILRVSSTAANGNNNDIYFSEQSGYLATACKAGGINSGTSVFAMTANTWHHIAMVKNNGTIYLYNNGVYCGSLSDSNDYSGSYYVYGGLYYSSSYCFAGHLSDFRISNSAIYTSGTSNFTVPTEPLSSSGAELHTCHLPYIADGSTNNHSITVNGDVSTKPFSPYDYSEYDATDHGGSVHFDGSGDYLDTNSAINLSSGGCIEGWVYITSATNYAFFIASTQGTPGYPRWYVGHSNATDWRCSPGDSTDNNITSYDLIKNQWNHFVLSNDGSTSRLFANGVLIFTKSVTPVNENLTFAFSKYGSSAQYLMIGNLSDVRVTTSIPTEYQTSSTTVGSSIFTPPTAPLSSSGAELHIKGTDASIIDKSQGDNLKLFGNTTGSTTQAKFSNTKSMYFDGTGDYISIPADDSIFSKDYTIEFWMYPTQDTNFTMPFSKGVGLQFYHQSGNIAAAMSVSNSGTYFYNGNFGSITTNAWSHISLVRDSSANTYKFYINGTLEDTLNSSSNIDAGSADWIIGAYSTAGNYAFEGYIQDVRVTEGLTRYTANFTPPTASLEG